MRTLGLLFALVTVYAQHGDYLSTFQLDPPTSQQDLLSRDLVAKLIGSSLFTTDMVSQLESQFYVAMMVHAASYRPQSLVERLMCVDLQYANITELRIPLGAEAADFIDSQILGYDLQDIDHPIIQIAVSFIPTLGTTYISTDLEFGLGLIQARISNFHLKFSGYLRFDRSDFSNIEFMLECQDDSCSNQEIGFTLSEVRYAGKEHNFVPSFNMPVTKIVEQFFVDPLIETMRKAVKIMYGSEFKRLIPKKDSYCEEAEQAFKMFPVASRTSSAKYDVLSRKEAYDLTRLVDARTSWFHQLHRQVTDELYHINDLLESTRRNLAEKGARKGINLIKEILFLPKTSVDLVRNLLPGFSPHEKACLRVLKDNPVSDDSSTWHDAGEIAPIKIWEADDIHHRDMPDGLWMEATKYLLEGILTSPSALQSYKEVMRNSIFNMKTAGWISEFNLLTFPEQVTIEYDRIRLIDPFPLLGVEFQFTVHLGEKSVAELEGRGLLDNMKTNNEYAGIMMELSSANLGMSKKLILVQSFTMTARIDITVPTDHLRDLKVNVHSLDSLSLALDMHVQNLELHVDDDTAGKVNPIDWFDILGVGPPSESAEGLARAGQSILNGLVRGVTGALQYADKIAKLTKPTEMAVEFGKHLVKESASSIINVVAGRIGNKYHDLVISKFVTPLIYNMLAEPVSLIPQTEEGVLSAAVLCEAHSFLFQAQGQEFCDGSLLSIEVLDRWLSNLETRNDLLKDSVRLIHGMVLDISEANDPPLLS